MEEQKVIFLTREQLINIIHCATCHVKHFVMNEDGFINDQLNKLNVQEEVPKGFWGRACSRQITKLKELKDKYQKAIESLKYIAAYSRGHDDCKVESKVRLKELGETE